MTATSSPELLVLHAVRLKGMADTDAVAKRFSMDREQVGALLSEYQARDWIQHVAFAGLGGWTLTDRGRVENERRLAIELAEIGARDSVASAHAAFLELNGRFLPTVTSWQSRPTQWDPLAANDHSDWRWDEHVLAGLSSLLSGVEPVCAQLAESLARFSGYTDRLAGALERAHRGETAWVDQPEIDSLHAVWFELHEDLLATLGKERGSES